MNVFLCFLLYSLTIYVKGDRPCVLRDYGNDKNVCVCNSTYCDTIGRVHNIKEGTFVAFVSSKEGLRFKKTKGHLEKGQLKPRSSSSHKSLTFTVNSSIQYQEIFGFGGAFTDAAGINILSLGLATQDKLLRSYFSKEGIEYDLCRVPIGGTDFSVREYAYDDGTADPSLQNFTLAKEDFKYKIPLIQRAMAMSSKEIHFVTASWSPPKWMKTSDSISGFGFLKKEYYDSYAKYLLKFLDEYNTYNISFWGISTGNEPSNGVVPLERFNSLGWTPWSFADWIVNYFGPQLRNSTHNRTMILTVDDQRILLPWVIDWLVLNDKNVLNYIDGIAVHWYMDFFVPDYVIKETRKKYPGKFILYTEACQGDKPWDKKVDIGSWERGEGYIKSIIENVNVDVTGWIDWNLALNLNGGPNWAKNYVDSPILVNASADEFYKQPMFYAMGHVSKFIEKYAVRIEITPTDSNGVHAMAVQNPDGRIVIVILNKNNENKEVTIDIQGKGWATLEVPPKSFASFLC